jgi:hypothetical protein
MTLDELLDILKFLRNEAKKINEQTPDTLVRIQTGGSVVAFNTVINIIEEELAIIQNA